MTDLTCAFMLGAGSILVLLVVRVMVIWIDGG